MEIITSLSIIENCENCITNTCKFRGQILGIGYIIIIFPRLRTCKFLLLKGDNVLLTGFITIKTTLCPNSGKFRVIRTYYL